MAVQRVFEMKNPVTEEMKIEEHVGDLSYSYGKVLQQSVLLFPAGLLENVFLLLSSKCPMIGL